MRRAEIDRAIAYGLAGRTFSIISGPITVLLIASRFSGELQGYYYTFNSLLGLQAFVELGLTTVVTQFASHEWARLSLHPERGTVEGDTDALSRLVSLGRVASTWFAVASVLSMAGLGAGGFYFFSQTPSHGIDWQAPWIALCVLSAANLFLLPVFSLLEGCNQVSTVYAYRSTQVVLANAAAWATMWLGGGLWAAPAYHATALAAALIFLLGRYRTFLAPFLRPPKGPVLSWRADLLPMQWRLAIGYLFSYFTFGVFTPLMFHYRGAVVAGQMGLTMTLVLLVGTIAALWSSTKAPQFGMLIARKAYAELDRVFLRVAIRAEGVLFGGGLAAWLGIVILYETGLPVAQRFLPPLPTLLLVGGMVLGNFCSPMVVYMRAHKREPYVVLSVTVAVLTGVSAWLMAMRSGPTGVAAAYFAISALVSLPGGLLIFLRRRREWHA